MYHNMGHARAGIRYMGTAKEEEEEDGNRNGKSNTCVTSVFGGVVVVGRRGSCGSVSSSSSC
jgi:hypothetical protein